MRLRVTSEPIEFVDRIQGRARENLAETCGDFVIWRRDGLVAYHLAVVVDDYEQGVTEIVRGIDLMDSTCRQIWLQQLLGYPTPGYLHIPVAAHADGQKLSKLTGAKAVPVGRPEQALVQALSALGQQPPTGLYQAPLQEIWSWAVEHWHIGALAGKTRILVDSNAMAEGKNGLL